MEERRMAAVDFMQEKRFPFYIMRCVHDYHHVPNMHSHEFVELVYVVKGEATHCFEGEEYPIRTGDVFIVNPGEKHTFRLAPGHEIEIINCLFLPDLIHGTCLRELGVDDSMDYFYVQPFLSRSERFHHRLVLSEREKIGVLNLLEQMMEEWMNRVTGFSTIIRLKLVELFILLSRVYTLRRTDESEAARTNARHLLIRRINGFLERHYDEKLSVSELGKLFNISSRQLNRVFKMETGATVIERVHLIRIEHAKRMLKEGDDKVLQVAQKVGYDDPAFFSQLFRRYVGCPPGRYRGFGNEK